MIVIGLVSTKGGVTKTTNTANLGALLAHMGFKVLMIDADNQPALSKYFPISFAAPNGLTRVIHSGVITADEISEITMPEMMLPSGERPVLDIVTADSSDGSLQTWLILQLDRATRLKNPIIHSQEIRSREYDFVLIDSPGAVGALQDAVVVACNIIISPVIPETLPAREFLEGTSALIQRLSRSATMLNMELGTFKGLICRQNRTNDSKAITREIRDNFVKLGGKVDSFQTVIPQAKAYPEATTRKIPVHLHEPSTTTKTPSAYEVMHRLAYEIVPSLRDYGLHAPVEGADLTWLNQLAPTVQEQP